MRVIAALLFTRSVLIAIVLFAAAPAHAGSIEYLTNQSADYIRTFSRNAAIDGADIISFNPAGTTWLKDGIYASFSNQTLIGEYGINYDGKDYTADIMVPALPSLHGVFKRGSLAVFGAFTIPAGGGSLKYDDGLPYLIPLVTYVDEPKTGPPTDGEFGGSSIFYGLTVGAAYKLADMVSLSLAVRAVLAKKAFTGHATYGATKAELDTKKDAMGFTPIVGIAVRPGFGLTIAARYEMATAMEFKTTSTLKGMDPAKFKAGALESFIDGATEKRDMPAVLGLGLAWSGMGATISTSFHFYGAPVEADAEKDDPGIPGTGGLGAYTRGWDDDYEDGWDLSFAVEYQVTKTLLVSAGYIKAKIGGNKATYNDFEYALDSNSVCGGARYAVNDKLQVTLGLSRTFYDDGSNDALVPLAYPKPETYSKRVMDLALGAQYRF